MTWYYMILIFLAVMIVFKIYYMTVQEKRRLEIEDSRNKDKDKELNDIITKQESKRTSQRNL